MQRAIIIVGILGAVGAAAWWLFNLGPAAEISWGEGWPATVRAVGESVEPIEAGPDGEITAGDRARAVERARWKAYYYAQLRLAEQLGELQIDANTTIKDTRLMDQELWASVTATVRAAAEVPGESSVEDLGDAVRATVVVEAPGRGIASLREALAAAIRSGRLRLGSERGREASREDVIADAGVPPADVAEAADQRPAPANPGPGAVVDRPASSGRAEHTGCVVRLEPGAEMFTGFPDFYDNRGTLLATSLDLPSDRFLAGPPTAEPWEDEEIRAIAGGNPLAVEAAVSGGNVVLREGLDQEEASSFKRWLTESRLVVVLGGEAS